MASRKLVSYNALVHLIPNCQTAFEVVGRQPKMHSTFNFALKLVVIGSQIEDYTNPTWRKAKLHINK